MQTILDTRIQERFNNHVAISICRLESDWLAVSSKVIIIKQFKRNFLYTQNIARDFSLLTTFYVYFLEYPPEACLSKELEFQFLFKCVLQTILVPYEMNKKY